MADSAILGIQINSEGEHFWLGKISWVMANLSSIVNHMHPVHKVAFSNT